MCSYLLENCKNIDDVNEITPKLNVLLTKIDNIEFSLHWLAVDITGSCIVLEVLNKELTIYENNVGVITNYPSFPEQLNNLEKYDYLSKYTTKGSCYEGTGSLGLPGDSTSPSRFVRA